MTEAWKRQATGWETLFAYSEPLDKVLVSVKIRVPKIIQQPSPLAYELQKATTRMVILNMDFEVLGKVLDPLA